MSSTFLFQDERTKKFYVKDDQWTSVPHIALHVSNQLEAERCLKNLQVRYSVSVKAVEMNRLYVRTDHHVVCFTTEQIKLLREALDHLDEKSKEHEDIAAMISQFDTSLDLLMAHMKNNDHSVEKLSGLGDLYQGKSVVE